MVDHGPLESLLRVGRFVGKRRNLVAAQHASAAVGHHHPGLAFEHLESAEPVDSITGMLVHIGQQFMQRPRQAQCSGGHHARGHQLRSERIGEVIGRVFRLMPCAPVQHTPCAFAETRLRRTQQPAQQPPST